MSRTYTANDICRAINTLDKTQYYGYLDAKNRGEIKIVSVKMPEGPIVIQRRKSSASPFGENVSLSSQMLWRTANALNSGIPVNLDRVLGASYNTRSVLESLLAHTPEIYTCLPGRIESIQGHETIERGHKHIILSDEPHALGEVQSMNLGEDCVISEIPSVGMMYDVVPPVRPNDTVDIEIRRRHSQMQIALAEIAKALDMRTWLAVEDHGIRYAGRVITEYPFIVHDLFRERVISSYPEAINVGKHIDCMYFNGGLPFAFEVEHSTGVTSGLTRMLSFKNQGPNLSTHYVIVAPDDDRNLVMQRAQPEQFEDLHPLYFPYSQIEELYSFVKRHAEKHGGKLRGVKKEDFLLNFMEECRAA